MPGVIIAPWQADDRQRLPEGFALGACTAAPRVEAPDEPPSRGPDASDALRRPRPSPRFLTRHDEDFAIVAELGCTIVRFSISWARVQPGGRGRLREDAVSAYRRVAEAAMARGLRPIVTFVHHDPPGSGWLEPDAAERFGELAERLASRFADAEAIVPIEEPAADWLAQCAQGVPPVLAAGILARAWRLGVEGISSACAVALGMSAELATAFPATASAADLAAARFSEAARTRAWLALAAGDEGALLARLQEHGAISPWRAQALAAIDTGCGRPADLLILRPRAAERVAASRRSDFAWDAAPAPPAGWEAWVPLAAAWGSFAALDRPPRLLVASDCVQPTTAPSEQLDASGVIDDAPRARALAEASSAWKQAVRAGVPLAGWLAGDLLDGFDPESGHSTAGGIVRADPSTGRRVIKASARTLRALVEEWS